MLVTRVSPQMLSGMWVASSRCIQMGGQIGVGENVAHVVKLSKRRQVNPAKLGRIDQSDDLAGAVNHEPLELCAADIAFGQPGVRCKAGAGDKGGLDVQIGQKVLANQTGHRCAAGVEHAAEQDDGVAEILGKGPRNVKTVGDNGEVAAVLQETRQVIDRCTGIEEDGIAVFDKIRRPAGDALLGCDIDPRGSGKHGALDQRLIGRFSAAAHTRQVAGFRQRIEVVADRSLGNIQPLRQLRHADAGFFVNQSQETLSPLSSSHGSCRLWPVFSYWDLVVVC